MTRSTRGTTDVGDVGDVDVEVDDEEVGVVVVAAGPARRGAEPVWSEHDTVTDASATDAHIAANRRGVTSRVAPAG